MFGGKDFTKPPYNKNTLDHPKESIYWYTKKSGEKVYSTAAGAYQIMGYVWDDNQVKGWRKKYKINDFSPLSQDLLAVAILKHK